MEYRSTKGFEIEGHLDIIVTENKDDFEGNKEKWKEISIYGDPAGLRSLAKQLIYLADLNQEKVEDEHLPIGAREHITLRPNFELSKSSSLTIIGRLDSKKEGKFYEGYSPKDELSTKKNGA